MIRVWKTTEESQGPARTVLKDEDSTADFVYQTRNWSNQKQDAAATLNCSFSNGICGYTIRSKPALRTWKWKIAKSRNIPTNLPETGSDGKAYRYLYIPTSRGQGNTTLASPQFLNGKTSPYKCLQFWFYQSNSSLNGLTITVKKGQKHQLWSAGQITTRGKWTKVNINLFANGTSLSKSKILFVATKAGRKRNAAVAFDDLRYTASPCPQAKKTTVKHAVHPTTKKAKKPTTRFTVKPATNNILKSTTILIAKTTKKHSLKLTSAMTTRRTVTSTPKPKDKTATKHTVKLTTAKISKLPMKNTLKTISKSNIDSVVSTTLQSINKHTTNEPTKSHIKATSKSELTKTSTARGSSATKSIARAKQTIESTTRSKHTMKSATKICPTEKLNTEVVPTMKSTTRSDHTIRPTTASGPTAKPITRNSHTIHLITRSGSTVKPITRSGPPMKPTTRSGPTMRPTTRSGPSMKPITRSGHTIKPTTRSSHTINLITRSGSTVKPTTRSGPTINPITKSGLTGKPITRSGHIIIPSTRSGSTVKPITRSSPTINPITTSGPTVKPTTRSGPTINPITTSGPIVKPTTRSGSTINPITTSSPTTKPTTRSGPTINPITTSGPTVKPTTRSGPTINSITTSGPTVKPTTRSGPIMKITTRSGLTIRPTTTSGPTAKPITRNSHTVHLITRSGSTVKPITRSGPPMKPTTRSSPPLKPATITSHIKKPTTRSGLTIKPTTRGGFPMKSTSRSSHIQKSTTRSIPPRKPTTRSGPTIKPTTRSETTVNPSTRHMGTTSGRHLTKFKHYKPLSTKHVKIVSEPSSLIVLPVTTPEIRQTIQGSCSFDTPNHFCGFTNKGAATTAWQQVREYDKGYYLATDASSSATNSTIYQLVSPQLKQNCSMCFTFSYYMYGNGTETLNVNLFYNNTIQNMMSIRGRQGKTWLKGQFPITDVYTAYKIILEAVIEPGCKGYIAVDDFAIQDGDCQENATLTTADCSLTNHHADFQTTPQLSVTTSNEAFPVSWTAGGKELETTTSQRISTSDSISSQTVSSSLPNTHPSQVATTTTFLTSTVFKHKTIYTTKVAPSNSYYSLKPTRIVKAFTLQSYQTRPHSELTTSLSGFILNQTDVSAEISHSLPIPHLSSAGSTKNNRRNEKTTPKTDRSSLTTLVSGMQNQQKRAVAIAIPVTVISVLLISLCAVIIRRRKMRAAASLTSDLNSESYVSGQSRIIPVFLNKVYDQNEWDRDIRSY
ncbi:uncharacterized protein [Watersipora subatra]|uniref:uncharacterized protein n=1 Tax=Watersipora subatra TaxID=2589382 RepID=UPI00355B6D10